MWGGGEGSPGDGMGWGWGQSGRGKRQEEQKALVLGGQLGKGSNAGRRGFPEAVPGSMLGESSRVTS